MAGFPPFVGAADPAQARSAVVLPTALPKVLAAASACSKEMPLPVRLAPGCVNRSSISGLPSAGGPIDVFAVLEAIWSSIVSTSAGALPLTVLSALPQGRPD